MKGKSVMGKVVIFGAGKIGLEAIEEYADRVAYVIDNNPQSKGKCIGDIVIKSVDDYLIDKGKYKVIIASKYVEEMSRQLESMGISNYEVYNKNPYAFYHTNKLVVNPYINDFYRDLDEEAWNKREDNKFAIEEIDKQVESLYYEKPLFNHVEIETVNRCNGSCDFCPVSKNRDSREYKEMSWELFEKIISQLAEINYGGKIALYSNNEPFLDSAIVDKYKYTREKLPKARLFIFTNGTLLTIEKFQEIIKYLDEMIIDNYHQELKLIRPCEEIVKYCKEHPELKNKVTIVLRKPHEILTSRGGDAPNRKEIISYEYAKCVLPFKQLIIRPDGKVSLCCNDPLGKETLGDLSKESILDVWYGEQFQAIRDALYKGRGSLGHCKWCDTFLLG